MAWEIWVALYTEGCGVPDAVNMAWEIWVVLYTEGCGVSSAEFLVVCSYTFILIVGVNRVRNDNTTCI